MLSFFKGRDLLLRAAQIVIWGINGFLIFGFVMVCVGLLILLTVQRADMMAQLAAAGHGIGGFVLVLLGTALVGLLLALAFKFSLLLLQIIDSVEAGDPFIPPNADRLRDMGWLTVACHAVLLALIGIALWFNGVRERIVAEDAANMMISGLVLTLILFILARVFRKGAEMRADLEGMV